MKGVTREQAKQMVVKAITELTDRNSIPPSYREVAIETGLSLSYVHSLVSELKGEGRVLGSSQTRRARSLVLLRGTRRRP